jgi:hypothetical protein
MAGHTKDTWKPVRAGVFASLDKAEKAVQNLLAAGFTKQQVWVICSDEAKQHHFKDFEAPHPSPGDAANSGLEGSVFGALIGGAIGVLMTASTTLPVLVIAPGMLSGALAGGLLGMMSTRGEEKEIADFYDRAVSRGMLLVAVEYHGDDPEAMLPRAEHALSEAGAEPLPMVEG